MKQPIKTIDQLPKYRIDEMPMEEVIEAVGALPLHALKEFYIKICGDNGLLKLLKNTTLLQRQICHELQKGRYGKLSVNHYNTLYRLSQSEKLPQVKDKYEPNKGTLLTRKWKNCVHKVYVLDKGFEYKGEVYNSLSKIAKMITGNERSGPQFFGLK